MFLFRNFLNMFFYSFSCFLSWDLLFVLFLFLSVELCVLLISYCGSVTYAWFFIQCVLLKRKKTILLKISMERNTPEFVLFLDAPYTGWSDFIQCNDRPCDG